MLSTFADRAISSRFSLILYLFIALLLRATTCQSTGNEQTIDATNLTFIIYQPALDDASKKWDVDSSKPHMPVVSTEHHNVSAHFQFKGTSVSLLADLSKFTADKMFVIVDSHEKSMNISTLDKLPDQDGLFVFFIEEGFTGTDLHTILVGLDPEGHGSWNLVAVKYTPSNSPSATSQAFTATAATEGTPTPTPMVAVDRHHNNSGKIAGAVIGTLLGLAIVALISFYLHRRRLARKRALLAAVPLVIEKPKAGPRPHQTSRSFLQRMNSRRLPRFVAPPSVWPSSRSSSEYNELPHSADHRRQNHHQEPPPPLGNEEAATSDPKHASCPQGGFFVTNPSLNPSNASSGGGIVRSATAPPPATYFSRPLARIVESTTSSVPTEKWLKERKAVAKGKSRAMPDTSVAHPKSRISRARSLRTFFTTNPSPSTYSSSTTSSKRSKELKTQPEVPTRPMEQKIPPTTLPIVATALKVESSHTPKRTASPSGRSRESRTVFFTTNPSPPSVPDPADTAIADLITSDDPRPRIDKGKGRAL